MSKLVDPDPGSDTEFVPFTADQLVRVDSYSISANREDRDPLVFGLKVAWRGPGDKYAVTHFDHYCLNSDGEWEMEPSPSNRDDEFKARCRFTHDEAIRLAVNAYNEMVVTRGNRKRS